jgi:hypothetical protein
LNASQLTAGTVPDARLGETIARTSNVWLLGGGARNGILQDNQHAAIVGGRDNRIGTNAANAVIVGGTNNIIADNASNSFAAGWRSRVNHPGAFVVSDSQQRQFRLGRGQHFQYPRAGRHLCHLTPLRSEPFTGHGCR